MTATLTAPLFEIGLSDLSFETEAPPRQSPSAGVEEAVECKCKLAAFGRCPTQLAS